MTQPLVNNFKDAAGCIYKGDQFMLKTRSNKIAICTHNGGFQHLNLPQTKPSLSYHNVESEQPYWQPELATVLP